MHCFEILLLNNLRPDVHRQPILFRFVSSQLLLVDLQQFLFYFCLSLLQQLLLPFVDLYKIFDVHANYHSLQHEILINRLNNLVDFVKGQQVMRNLVSWAYIISE